MRLLLENKTAPNAPRCDSFVPSVWNDYIDTDDGRAVIFNTLRRNAVLLEKEEVGVALEKLPEKGVLQQLGILVSPDLDERTEFGRFFHKAKTDMGYLDLTILLTENCQMNCVYCFEGEKKRVNISAAAVDQILSFICDNARVCYKLRITWFGGEPLLAYNSLRSMSKSIIEICDNHNIEYSADITTNGFALNRERCNELVNDLKVKRFIITVDGPEHIHDIRRPHMSKLPTYKIIMRNIELLTDAGAWVTLRVTIDKQNADSIPSLLDEIATGPLYRRIGLAFSRTVAINYTPEEISDMLLTEKEYADIEWKLIQYAHNKGIWRYDFPYAAPAGGCLREADIVIGANGETYKCLDTIGDARWMAGYIGETSSSSPSWMLRWNDFNPANDSRCGKCVLLPLCNGGCPHNAIFTDKKHGTDSSCPDWKPNYRRIIKALVNEI